MTSKRGKRQGLRARSKNARVTKKTGKRPVKAKAKKKSVAAKRAKRPRLSVRENPRDRVAAPASPSPVLEESSSQSERRDAEGGTPASTEREAEFQQSGETPVDPFEETLPVPAAPEPYDLPDGTPNPNAPDTVYS